MENHKVKVKNHTEKWKKSGRKVENGRKVEEK